MRLDHIFSRKDWLSAIYTIDDSADFTPTSYNAYMTDADTLREQVASLQETHVFSPTRAEFGDASDISRAGYFFTGEPTPGTPAASLPGFLAGRSHRRAGSGRKRGFESDCHAQPGRSNNGSNLRVARNIFTYEDQVSHHQGPPSVQRRRVVPAAGIE